MFDIIEPPLFTLLLLLLELLRLNGTLVETPTRCIKTKNSREERVRCALFDTPARFDFIRLVEWRTVRLG